MTGRVVDTEPDPGRVLPEVSAYHLAAGREPEQGLIRGPGDITTYDWPQPPAGVDRWSDSQ